MHPKTLIATALLIATPHLYAVDTGSNKPIADNAKQTVISTPENKDEAEMTPNDYKAMITNLDDVRRLPVTGISLVRSGDQMLLISDNGRFAVTGKFRLIDIWNAKEIKTMDDAVGFDKLDLKKVGIKDSDLSMLTLGNGPKEVMAFVDPYCKHCHNLIGQIDDALKAAYTFKLVLVPVGKESAVTIKKLMCNKDRAASLKALIDQDFSKLPEPDAKCDLKPLQKTLISAKLLDIGGVPYLILPSKTVHKGGTKSLKELLENDGGQ